jgi:hypothetical protein
MATNLQTGPEPSTASLVAGIVHDAQELIKQQLALFQHELKQDVERAKETAISLAFSLPLVLLSVVLLSLMVVHLLNWLAPAALPLWACYGIVGGALALASGCLAWYGYKRLESIHPLDDQAAQALKENLEWTTKPK